MPGTRRSNKARNQTTGTHRHVDDATWFTKNTTRQRKRNKIAAAARRANRKKRQR